MVLPSIHRHFELLGVCVLLAGLGACSSPSSLQRPAEPTPPPAWQQAEAPQASAPVSSPDMPWWKALDDPRLDALQTQALRANIDTQRKILAWQAAQAQVRLTAQDENISPTLSLNMGANRPLHTSGGSTIVVNGVSVPVSQAVGTSRSYGVSAGFGYEWDLWSRLEHGTQAAVADAQGRREDLLTARWLLSAKVAEAYWSVAAIDAKLPLLSELVQASDEAVKIGELRLREGRLRPDEVNVLVTRQQEAVSRLTGAQADRRLQLHALTLLLDDEPRLDTTQAQLPQGDPRLPPLGTPGQTLERRPDVRQARLSVDSALARLRVAEASRYPALRLNFGLQTNGSTWRDWVSQPLATLGANLMVPLVDWRHLDVRRDVARNSLDDAALALRASVRQALMDVENALAERERWQADWQALQSRRSARDQIYAVALLRREAGVYGRLNVLEGRQDVLGAQIDAIDLRLRAWLNQLSLYKALGGAV